MIIETITVDSLIPYARNSRTHAATDATFDEVMADSTEAVAEAA